jgi:hypothetical protein
LIDEAGHKGQEACPLKSIVDGRTFIINVGLFFCGPQVAGISVENTSLTNPTGRVYLLQNSRRLVSRMLAHLACRPVRQSYPNRLKPTGQGMWALLPPTTSLPLVRSVRCAFAPLAPDRRRVRYERRLLRGKRKGAAPWPSA